MKSSIPVATLRSRCLRCLNFGRFENDANMGKTQIENNEDQHDVDRCCDTKFHKLSGVCESESHETNRSCEICKQGSGSYF